jgi:hypothetical protein
VEGQTNSEIITLTIGSERVAKKLNLKAQVKKDFLNLFTILKNSSNLDISRIYKMGDISKVANTL